MNEFNIQDKGITRVLHRIAKFGGWKYRNPITDEPNDFCYWTRRVIWGGFWIAVIAALVGMLWALCSIGAYKEHLMDVAWPQWVKYAVAVIIPPGLLALILGGLFGGLFCVAWVFDSWLLPWHRARQQRLRHEYATKQADPNALTGWDAFKNKYCIRMNVPKRHR